MLFKNIITFHDGGPYHIETSPSIYCANRCNGFYMIGTSVMKELKLCCKLIHSCLFIIILLYTVRGQLSFWYLPGFWSIEKTEKFFEFWDIDTNEYLILNHLLLISKMYIYNATTTDFLNISHLLIYIKGIRVNEKKLCENDAKKGEKIYNMSFHVKVFRNRF